MGCLMDAISICMITVPIFMPIVNALHLDPIWWGVMMVINYEIGTLTPPFGLCCFVMKGVDPETSITDIFKAGVPFLWRVSDHCPDYGFPSDSALVAGLCAVKKDRLIFEFCRLGSVEYRKLEIHGRV